MVLIASSPVTSVLWLGIAAAAGIVIPWVAVTAAKDSHLVL